MNTGTVVSVNISKHKGTCKEPVENIELIEGSGVASDAHAGGIRQVSVLETESAKDIKEFKPGIYAENITVTSAGLTELKIGDSIKVGEAVIKLTEIGKVCPKKCAIYYKMGDCIMPRAGLFFDVSKGGIVMKGDQVERG